MCEPQDMFDNQMAEKKRIEDGAMMLQRKMNQVRAPPTAPPPAYLSALLQGERGRVPSNPHR